MGPLDFLNKPGGAFLMNLLAQSGYSTMPDSPFGAVGRAQLATRQQQMQKQQMDQQAESNDIRNRLLESQIGLNRSSIGNATRGLDLREREIGIRENQLASQSALSAPRVQSTQTLANGNIGLVMSNGEVVDTGEKTANNRQLVHVPGAGYQVFNPRTQELTPVSSEQQVIQSKADTAAATTSATTQAEIETEAKATLPKREAAANRLREQIETLRTHPGRSKSLGLFALSPVIPGTEQEDFVNRLSQINSATFLEAFQQLKGGGPITDREGEKATEAFSRLRRTAGKEAFDEAIDDLLQLIDEGVKQDRSLASGEAFQPTMRFNPDTGQIEAM